MTPALEDDPKNVKKNVQKNEKLTDYSTELVMTVDV
jgi:hypothetical protein